MRLDGAFLEPGSDDGSVWLDRFVAIYLPRGGQITFAQLDQALNQAIRDRAITFELPETPIANGTLWVTDVALPVEVMRRLGPLEEVVVEDAKVKLRRIHLFQRPMNRSLMQPAYNEMEDVLRAQLECLRRAGEATAARRTQAANAQRDPDEDVAFGIGRSRCPLGRRLDNILLSGLRRCAKAMRLQLDFSPRRGPAGVADPASVKLLAPPGTTIEFVYQLDRQLWALMGKSEDEYQWQTYTAGETVNLLGGYWFRVTYSDGRRVRVYKKVRANDTELHFPSK